MPPTSSLVCLSVSMGGTFVSDLEGLKFFVHVADMKDKPLEEWKPRNRVEMDAYRKRLVDIITPTAVSCGLAHVVGILLMSAICRNGTIMAGLSTSYCVTLPCL